MEEAERLCDRVAIMDHGVMIALGSPRDLIGSLGAEQVVEYTIAGDGAPEALDGELRALPGVRAVRTREGVASLTVAALHRTLPALMGLFERRGVTLASLTTHHAWWSVGAW